VEPPIGAEVEGVILFSWLLLAFLVLVVYNAEGNRNWCQEKNSQQQ